VSRKPALTQRQRYLPRENARPHPLRPWEGPTYTGLCKGVRHSLRWESTPYLLPLAPFDGGGRDAYSTRAAVGAGGWEVLVFYSRISAMQNEDPRFSKKDLHTWLLRQSLGIYTSIRKHEIICSSWKVQRPFRTEATSFHKYVCVPEPSVRRLLLPISGKPDRAAHLLPTPKASPDTSWGLLRGMVRPWGTCSHLPRSHPAAGGPPPGNSHQDRSYRKSLFPDAKAAKVSRRLLRSPLTKALRQLTSLEHIFYRIKNSKYTPVFA